jgi:hypothetical protein
MGIPGLVFGGLLSLFTVSGAAAHSGHGDFYQASERPPATTPLLPVAPPPPQPKVYCKWCGSSFPDIRTLAINTCQRNPEGRAHELYEGREKPRYTCKFCGDTFRTIGDMSVTKTCRKRANKRHEPAL